MSDHGHARVSAHEDLAGLIASWGHSVRAHPFVLGGRDVAVMVSGNSMAHLYLEMEHRVRPWWEPMRARWTPMLKQLLARASVDLALLPLSVDACEVHTGARGAARVERLGDGRIRYRCITGDPLLLGGDITAISDYEAWERSIDSTYPDALVQILAIAAAPRSGEIILSAAPGCDLRSRYEPALHVSGHGALHREHMLVPLLMSSPASGTPRRTTDIFPSALRVLGLEIPPDLDGTGFR